MNPKRQVAIIRKLRDGSTTEENMAYWLAVIEVGAIVTDEPNTASARIVEIADAPTPSKRLRQDWQSVALFIAGEFGQAVGMVH